MDALFTGRLILTDRCAFLETSDGQRMMLALKLDESVWTWDAGARQIVATSNGGMHRFGNGSPIAAGGGGMPSEVEVDWVVPPNPECLTASVFYASGELRVPDPDDF